MTVLRNAQRNDCHEKITSSHHDRSFTWKIFKTLPFNNKKGIVAAGIEASIHGGNGGGAATAGWRVKRGSLN